MYECKNYAIVTKILPISRRKISTLYSYSLYDCVHLLCQPVLPKVIQEAILYSSYVAYLFFWAAKSPRCPWLTQTSVTSRYIQSNSIMAVVFVDSGCKEKYMKDWELRHVRQQGLLCIVGQDTRQTLFLNFISNLRSL